MTFSFTNYATNELSKSPLHSLVSDILGGYGQGVQASYLQPNLAETLQKAQLENKYYGPNMESQMGLRGAQAGLLGEQTKGAHIENEYLPKKMEAQIAQLNAQAQQARILQMIREQMISGGIKPQEGNASTPSFQGQGMPMAESSGTSMSPPQSGLDYGKAATMMQMLGLGKPHIVDANGRYMAITPFGAIDTGVSGLSARDQQLSREDAKKISHLEDIVLSGSQKQDTFNELNRDLGSPEFESIRQHPNLGGKELWWYEKNGTKAQQEMIGRVRTHMGNIIKDSSRDFAGQFRIGEQALLNSMKPNESDSLSTMKGKAEALTFMNQMLTQRSQMEADLMRNNNMSLLQAKRIADQSVDPQKIKEEIKTILHPASSKSMVTIRNKNTGETTRVTREEARKRGLNV